MGISPGTTPRDGRPRLAAARRYEVLDSPQDGAVDRVTQLAARMFDVPIVHHRAIDVHRVNANHSDRRFSGVLRGESDLPLVREYGWIRRASFSSWTRPLGHPSTNSCPRVRRAPHSVRRPRRPTLPPLPFSAATRLRRHGPGWRPDRLAAMFPPISPAPRPFRRFAAQRTSWGCSPKRHPNES